MQVVVASAAALRAWHDACEIWPVKQHQTQKTTCKRRVHMKHGFERLSLLMATLTIGLSLATPAWADHFFFSTGNTDARLGALSRRPSTGKIETETADDFVLTETTVISQATIVGLIPLGTP